MKRFIGYLMAAVLAFAPAVANATTAWQFSPTGNDSTGNGTSTPWFLPSSHMASFAAGDTGTLASGTYTETDSTNTFWIKGIHGTALAPIKFTCAGDRTCIIANNTTGAQTAEVSQGATYIQIGDTGHGFYFNQISATNQSASGLYIGGNGEGSYGAIHHITVKDSTFGNNGAAGISVAGNNNGNFAVDYITLDHNITFGNAFLNTFHTSGISVYEPINLDTLAGYHISIINNITYANHDCTACSNNTDGNGIIVDDLAWTQNTPITNIFKSAVLVANNFVFNNGGRGIHIFANGDQSPVDVVNNTACGNNVDTNTLSGANYEIGFSGSGGPYSRYVRFYNNIAQTARQNITSFSTTTTAARTGGEFNLTLASVTNIKSGAVITMPAFPLPFPTYTFGINSGTTISLSQSNPASSSGATVNILWPIWGIGMNGYDGSTPSGNVFDYNVSKAFNSQQFYTQNESFMTSSTFTHNDLSGDPLLTCPTYTTLQTFATLAAAAVPAGGSVAFKTALGAVAPHTDINGKVRNPWANGGQGFDKGAVQVSY